MSKTDFDNRLMKFNREITSNKTKLLEVQKKLNNLFLAGICFKSTDGSQNTHFLSTSTWYVTIRQKKKVLIMFLSGNQRWYIILNLTGYI